MLFLQFRLLGGLRLGARVPFLFASSMLAANILAYSLLNDSDLMYEVK